MLGAHLGESRQLTRKVWLFASIVLFGFVGCGPGEDLSAPPPVPGPSDTPSDGRHFGYIKTIDPRYATLTIDLAKLVTGDAADRAAAAAGEIEAGEQVPNDYFIDNSTESYVTLRVADDVVVRVVGDPPDLIEGDLLPFAASFAKRPDEIASDAKYRGVTSQYWVTVRDGVIVRIEEQYLP